jgi:hypothetical protein
LPNLFPNSYNMESRGVRYGPPPQSRLWTMNQWTSWHQKVTSQRPFRADYYDLAEFLGPNAQIGRGGCSGIRNPQNPHAQVRLSPHARDFDTMRKIAARGGRLLNHLDGYSGFGGQRQSLSRTIYLDSWVVSQTPKSRPESRSTTLWRFKEQESQCATSLIAHRCRPDAPVR